MSANPFEDFIKFIFDKHDKENWITVYKSDPLNNSDHDGGMYCALMSKDKTEKSMDQAGWGLMIGSEAPGFCISSVDGIKKTTYYTNAHEGFLRIILNRDFHGRKEGYIEILEEFRLFYNLYFDNKTCSYIIKVSEFIFFHK